MTPLSKILAEAKAKAEVPSEPEPAPESVTMRELLQFVPLHSPRTIEALFSHPDLAVRVPDNLDLHCDHAKCNGTRRHSIETRARGGMWSGDIAFRFFTYTCTNCTTTTKIFGIRCERSGITLNGICAKIYQEPTFGEPIPARLFKVIGEENREHFLNARRASARSLGIGAYAYYRRIVENNKFNLISSILQVAEATNADGHQVERLREAQKETQFSKAIDVVRDIAAVPAALLIDGHNPLLLLHDLLSDGIHELSDAECLARARHAEIILCEIAVRLQSALSDRKSVKEAIAEALKRKSAPKK